MHEHKTKYRVPYADVDQMGVVYYAHYLTYFERGRNEYLRELGLPYIELERQGVMLPVIESHCEYLRSAKYDDELTIITTVPEHKGIRVKMACTIMRGDEVLAKGYTWHVCTSLEGKPCRMPESLATVLTAKN